jgi:hypothetical protein
MALLLSIGHQLMVDVRDVAGDRIQQETALQKLMYGDNLLDILTLTLNHPIRSKRKDATVVDGRPISLAVALLEQTSMDFHCNFF